MWHCQCACRQREGKRVETIGHWQRNPGHIPTVGPNVGSLQRINGQTRGIHLPPPCIKGINHLLPGRLSDTSTKSQLPGLNMEMLPGTGPESTKSCWSRMEEWEGIRSWTVGGALDGWTASTSGSPVFVGLQLHKDVFTTKMCVWQTDWHALICADCKTVRTRHPTLNQWWWKCRWGHWRTD